MQGYYKFLRQTFLVVLFCLSSCTCEAGTWNLLNTGHLPPVSVTCPMLLTDGTILVQQYDSSATTFQIWRLTPDINGSYRNGTWSQLASLPSGYSPLYHASAVLANGQVVFIGGEYNQGTSNPPTGFTNRGALYDPVANTWTSFTAPPTFPNNSIGDASSVVLFDGSFMLASSITKQAAIYNFQTHTWTETGTSTKADVNDEEGWTLLPNNLVLTVNCGVGTSTLPTNSEIYNPATSPATGFWSTAGSTIHSLTDTTNREIGPAILRPDGTVLALGSTGVSSIYNTNAGIWTTGPTLPVVGGNQLGCSDAPAALLPNGNVLFAASPTFTTPISFFEFDGINFNAQPTVSISNNLSSYAGNLLVLPTGEVLLTTFTNFVYIYTPSNTTFNPAWQPVISDVQTSLFYGVTYPISGFLFNGMSQANMYGDDYQGASNYPIVRVTNNATGHVFYFRTHDHSSMGVAQTNVPVSTFFDVPFNIESGPSQLVVVANGIPSQPVNVVIEPPCPCD